MPSSKVTLVDGMQFVGVSGSGHAVVMDADQKNGGANSGARPMEFLLTGFGGCTGMDVISILRKKRQKVTSFEIFVEGEKAEGHPARYTKIHLEYVVTGKNISPEAVERAIKLSLDKYCSVGATLGKSAEISHEFRIIDSEAEAGG
ncbi:MAG: OsmC family protein [Nitrospirae bacterium]|nr:OsmC family protein [Nitrospirota bacterium]